MDDRTTFGGDYRAWELTVVQEPSGRWRPFVTRVGQDRIPIPFPDMFDPFALPTLPTRKDAEELGCLLIWDDLDKIQVLDNGGIFRPVDVLE
jgi:hypothetical protein